MDRFLFIVALAALLGFIFFMVGGILNDHKIKQTGVYYHKWPYTMLAMVCAFTFIVFLQLSHNYWIK